MTHITKGIKHFKQKEYKLALECFENELETNPTSFDALNNIGTVHLQLGALEKARPFLKKAINENPSVPQAHANLGMAYKLAGNLNDAEKHLKKAIDLNPNYSKAKANLGTIYQEKGELSKAKPLYESSLNYPDSIAFLYGLKRELCDWHGLDEASRLLEISGSESPFTSIVRSEDPQKNLCVAKKWSNKLETQFPKQFNTKLNPTKNVLNIGYISNGFCDFPTGHNLIGVFENSSKRVKNFAFSYGPNDNSTWRKRFEKSACKIVDIASISPEEAAKVINNEKIDILVDLKGYTRKTRLEIFAFKPAPVQVAYLGFPATTGANFIDYMIADQIVIPKLHQKYYSEKIIYLPNCYRATDDKQKISTKKFTKKEFNLPDNKFIYGSFNKSYKITPEIWDTWMKILNDTNSVLWQLEGHPDTNRNLLKEAKKRSASKDRIIFTKNLPKPEHLSRLKLADLILDTTPVNGHTSTIDALYVDVPVLSTLGKHFASRVSASCLNTIGLDELVVKDLKTYAKKAIDITKKSKIEKYKKIIKKNKTKLFNSKDFSKELEKAYFKIWQNHE